MNRKYLINNKNLAKIVECYRNKIASGEFFPAVYVVEPTNRCTLSCTMCPNSLIKENLRGNITIEKFELILKTISPYAEHVMLYFMGETLQHPQFEKLIAVAKKLIKGKLSISTNCIFLNSKNINTILKEKLDLVICCIDHWKEEEYSKIRIGGNFQKAVENTEELLNKRGDRKKPIVIVKSLDFGMSSRDKKRFLDHWGECRAVPIIGWVDTWAGQFPELLTKASLSQPYAKIERVQCADLWFKMVINWMGEVVLCCHNYDYSIKLGEIDSTESLSNVWQSEQIVSIRENHISKKFNCNEICKKCTEWGSIKELYTYCDFDINNLELIF